MELPTLETERLTLGPLRPADASRIPELAGDREIARNTESIPHPYPEEEAEAFVEQVRAEAASGEAAVFGIRLGDGGELVGVVGIHPEPEHGRARLGYWIGRPYWGRGFATEAAREAVDWAFRELDLRRVYAESFARNPASCRVLEKVGMRREGRLRRHFKKWGEFVDIEVFGLLREEHGAEERGA